MEDKTQFTCVCDEVLTIQICHIRTEKKVHFAPKREYHRPFELKRHQNFNSLICCTVSYSINCKFTADIFSYKSIDNDNFEKALHIRSCHLLLLFIASCTKLKASLFFSSDDNEMKLKGSSQPLPSCNGTVLCELSGAPTS